MGHVHAVLGFLGAVARLDDAPDQPTARQVLPLASEVTYCEEWKFCTYGRMVLISAAAFSILAVSVVCGSSPW